MFLHMDRYLKPDIYCLDLLKIDFQHYYQTGFRLVLLDVDNTMSRHGAGRPDEYARRLVGRIRAAGLDCRIVSNAGRKRIGAYASALDLPFIARAGKPSSKAIIRSCRQAHIPPEQTLMIGDQILTDIAAGHRAGCLAVLVHPRFKQEAWNVRLKRCLERLFYHRYKLDKL